MAVLKQKDIDDGIRIDGMVFRFQAGENNALEEALREFGGHPHEKVNAMIGKFYGILRYGRFNFDDKASRIFISCFMQQYGREMRKPYQYTATRNEALKTVTRLIDQCKAISDEDLLQDLRMLFCLQAKRYKKRKKNVWFPGYVYKTYAFALVDQIQNKLFKAYNPYMHMYTDKQLIPMNEELYVDDNTCIKIDSRAFVTQPMMVDDDELGNSWIRGLTCGEEFSKLTVFQRNLLKMYYEDGLSDQKIADRTGMHINTIHKQRKKSIQIVKETVDELRKDGHYE